MKFVIQHHICEDDHYDLMIESGDSLSTWRISPGDINPLLNGENISLKRIKDHRREYLTYEGPVSGGRGRVEIFDSGECELIPEKNKDIRQYRMRGKIFDKCMILQQAENQNQLQIISE